MRRFRFYRSNFLILIVQLLFRFLLNLLLADIASVIFLFPIVLYSFVQISSSSGTRKDLLVPSPFFHETNSNRLPLNVTIGTAAGDGAEGGQIEYSYWKWDCALSNGILAGLATSSVLAALEIAMERYLAVVKPLHYHKLLTTPSILVTSVIGGTISVGEFFSITLYFELTPIIYVLYFIV